jgi:hypothetical protein
MPDHYSSESFCNTSRDNNSQRCQLTIAGELSPLLARMDRKNHLVVLLVWQTKRRVIVDGHTTIVPQVGVYRICFQNPDHQIFAETVREGLPLGEDLGFSDDRIKTLCKSAQEMGFRAGGRNALPAKPWTKTEVGCRIRTGMEPSILIVDEPTTAGLERIHGLMELALDDNGHTCIITSHNMNLVPCLPARDCDASGCNHTGWPYSGYFQVCEGIGGRLD